MSGNPSASISPILIRPGSPSAVSISLASYLLMSSGYTSTSSPDLVKFSEAKNLFSSPIYLLTEETEGLHKLSSVGGFALSLL
jgi:hypothetical protein